ncbi:MAG: GGDEF domain-containing protein [Hyphomicrobiales bacterium]|nr:MAG: GGDEF domain-containing protein [Hyphomicrobiales bacterium]
MARISGRMDLPLFAFAVPATMLAFASAFVVAARWSGPVALWWAAGLLLSALGFAVPMLPLPPVVLALTASAVFLGAALAYGQALLLQVGQAGHALPTRAAVAAFAFAFIAIAVAQGDLRSELILADASWSVLLAWAIAMAVPKAKRPLHWVLIGVMIVMTLETVLRVMAVGWLVGPGSGPEDYFASDYAMIAQGTAGLIVTVFCLVAMGNVIETIVASFRREADQDPLTGLLNRRGIDRAAALLDPDRRPVSVIHCDLDHFKRINDGYGHAAGDEVLRGIAACIAGIVPAGGAVGRFGGEEFVILLDDMRLVEAGVLAHRLRLALANCNWQSLGIDEQLTASFGVAQWSSGDHALSDALNRADAALYLSKDGGRNQVYLESRKVDEPAALRLVRSA